MQKETLVVIGNGMVGHQFIEYWLQRNDPRYNVIVFGEEPRCAYDRVHLSEYFTDQSAERLALTTPDYYEMHAVSIFLNEKIISIDRPNKSVISDQGRITHYTKLVIATGSYPFVPPVEGRDRPGCFVYRTIEDLQKMLVFAKQCQIGTVIGGGLLGLEAANALRELHVTTHVVEFAPRLMAVQIDDGGGAVLRKKIESLGVSVHVSKNTLAIEPGAKCQNRLVFADGEHLETDMVIFSAGIRPRDELARHSGLELGTRGGISINQFCQTSDNDIYAIGECAAWQNHIYGLVAPGYQMAKVAASHLGDEVVTFAGADMSTKLKLLGVDVASFGDAHGRTVGALSYTYINEPRGIYKKLLVSSDHQQILGGILVGDASDYGQLTQMMINQLSLPEYPERLILPPLDGSGPILGIQALTDSIQICSCNNVTKGQICTAVQAGATTLGALKTATKAATSCGGCAPLVTQVLNHELTRMGVMVNKHVCEHFPYSRQELYHLVRVEQIKTFDELLEKHGRGLGCDICKPLAASIFASCWNDYVLNKSHVGLQDTNDRFLANMQKDGTYSVVPRVAGGEITPEKLIKLGEVGKKYGLYTKITGGQRIDLFGARLEQLPAIWQELIDAGFESGHAYAKALRTVKSCVGSTWCRFGVLDSVGLSIELENRYKGLRAPHKLKMAVSGCTRECAEAQGKDVGVIAVENGWNLYVCGNGGMKPRHADLFATGLDKTTLIKYIDRFFMFYIRTADRLQRTSVWLENLEGGLDYLKAVIIEDRLGICADLEAEMASLISTYQCEWQTTIADPAKIKRFRTFVNSKEQDNHVVFIEERGQIRPANQAERLRLARTA